MNIALAETLKVLRLGREGIVNGYDEEKHCMMMLKIMSDKEKGTMAHFCVEAIISETTFYRWLKKHPLFFDCYSYGKLLSRMNWENDGRELRDIVLPPGSVSHAFDYWKLIGWSRFGVSKNPRIKLDIDENSTPVEHYKQIIQQANNGDFTAAEIKQLMEAINVGLNAHQITALQIEIDQLKADLLIMAENSNADYRIPDQRFEKEDKDSVQDSVCESKD